MRSGGMEKFILYISEWQWKQEQEHFWTQDLILAIPILKIN